MTALRRIDHGIVCDGEDDGVPCITAVWLSQVIAPGNETPAGLRAYLKREGWVIGKGRRGRYVTAADFCPAHAKGATT